MMFIASKSWQRHIHKTVTDNKKNVTVQQSFFTKLKIFVIAEGDLQSQEGTLGQHVMVLQVAFGDDKA